MTDVGALAIGFVGEVTTVASTDTVTFGRCADIEIDNNRYLHRHVGQFFFDRGIWWIKNVGASIVLTLIDQDSASSTKIAPGVTVPITFTAATVVFQAGSANYELDVTISQVVPEPPNPDANAEADRTTSATDLPLSPEQRLLLTALAEPTLRSGGTINPLPTNRAIAARLGWSDAKFNRKLDAVCHKYAKAGVPGLVGSTESLARDRRLRLTEYALFSAIVTAADLPLLDQIDTYDT